jgi:CRP-like cAMP-binding protein
MSTSNDLMQLQRKYAAGEVIFSEQDLSRDLFVLLSGKVEVLQKGVKLAVLETKGAFFGEMALLTGQPRSATLRALKDAVMLQVSPEKLPILMKNMPDLAMKMAKNLAGMVNNLDKELLKAWEATTLVDMLKEKAELEPMATLEETLPKLFQQVQQQQSDQLLEVAQSYMRSNVFITPFTQAIQDQLAPFFDFEIEVSRNDGDVEILERLCGIDFQGVTAGTFIFMCRENNLQKIGKILFGDKSTEELENDALMELARGVIEKVKASVPGLNMELSTPEILSSYTPPTDKFMGVRLAANVGFVGWIHLNR